MFLSNKQILTSIEITQQASPLLKKESLGMPSPWSYSLQHSPSVKNSGGHKGFIFQQD